MIRLAHELPTIESLRSWLWRSQVTIETMETIEIGGVRGERPSSPLFASLAVAEWIGHNLRLAIIEEYDDH